MKTKQWISSCLLSLFVGVASGSAAASELPKDLAAASGLNFEFLPSQETKTPGGITVQRGANYVYTSYPQSIGLSLVDQGTSAMWKPGDPSWEVPKQRGTPAISNPRPVNPVKDPVDALLSRQSEIGTRAPGGFSVPLHSFDGIRSGANPNDSNGEVGKDWVVVAINGSGGSQYMFYDKTDPATTSGPYTLDALGSGPCSGGYGDPIMLYDEIAERWVLTEFSSAGNRMCVYVSKTSDPLAGGFWAYDFQAPSFPDYPKYAVWGDAYYIGTNESSSALYALDRTAMLDGNSATMQRFTATDPGAFSFAMIPPVDVDGQDAPPPNSPGTFIRHYDDEAHSPGSNNPAEDYLELFELDVDFDTPANSSLTGPIRIAIAEIDSDLCGFLSFECFPQQGAGFGLDPLREVVMNLPKYRNFGSHESIVGNLVTDVDGTDHGGVRWFELRRSGGGAWSLYQEGTYAPDAHNRFMAGSAIDSSGNIAMGYSTTSSSMYPSVRYTGQELGSPLGVMSEPETTLGAGTGPSDGNRWGDYASLSVDPVDGCTFWLVENYAVSGGAKRQNRVGAFRFDSCGEPTFIMSGTNLQQQVCTADSGLSNVELSIVGFMGFGNPVDLDFSNLPTGISGNFSPAQVNPGGSSTVDFNIDSGLVTPGLNDIVMRGMADDEPMTGTIIREVTLSAVVNTLVPEAPVLSGPIDAATEVPTSPILSWSGGAQSGDFTIEIATDPGFSNIVYSTTVNQDSHMVASALDFETTYYWRVRSGNTCGEGSDSAVFSFTTLAAPVAVCVSPDLSIPDNNPTGISSDIVLNLPDQNILDLNVSIDITHTYVGDLQIRLENVESATSVLLYNQHCGSGKNIDVVLDDAASVLVNVCGPGTPAIEGTKKPINALANFNGLPSSGTWRLKIADLAGQDLGTLNEWCVLHSSSQLHVVEMIMEDSFEDQ